MNSRTACIIAAGVWEDKRCLLKNRDRNYSPKVKLVRDLINDIEVLYMEDEVTGWCEGLNELGLGVVNSALAVGHDEAEKKLVKTVGKKSKDGERILAALGCKTLEKALAKARTFKGGIKGHTFVATPDEVVTLEQTSKHDCKVTHLDADDLHVRTNHGIEYEDAGYTKGADLVSSVARRDQALKVLRETDDPADIAPTLMESRKKNRKDPNNMVRDTKKMSTTSQMVLDLTSLELLLYVIRGKNEYQGLEDRLPKGRKPKIKVQVFEYVDNGDSVVELDPETGKAMKTKAKTANAHQGEVFLPGGEESYGPGAVSRDPTMLKELAGTLPKETIEKALGQTDLSSRVATRFQAERVATRFLAANTPDPSRVAARFLEAAGPLPTWTVQDPGNREQRGKATREAFEGYVGAEIPKAQKILKALAAYVKKLPQFEGYKVDLKDKGITGGEYGTPVWEAIVLLDNREAISLDITGKAEQKPRGEWASGPNTNPFELKSIYYHLTLLPRQNHYKTLSSATLPTAAGCKKFLDQYLAVLLEGVGGPKKGRHTDAVTPEIVKGFVSGLRTWFHLESRYEGDEPRYLAYATRDHGIRTDRSDEAGPEDIAEAKRLVAALRAEFGQAIRVDYETVDEWTSISIEIKK